MTEEERPKLQRSRSHRKKKSTKSLVFIGIAIVLLLGVVFGYQKVFNDVQPVSKITTDTKVISIPKGATTKSIATLLENEGLIRSKLSFEHYVRQHDYDGKLRNGNYSLSAHMSVDEIVNALLSGIGETVKFTIPEGYTLADICAVFVEQELMSEEEFWQSLQTIDLSDFPFIQETSDDRHRLEGYLFPDTYLIAANSSPDTIIQTMLKRFSDVYHNLPENASGLSSKEMVILASMIESESRTDEDRPLIASVYINRIASGMPLQCDATILYALPEHKERLFYSDYEYDSPYNTYLIKGFPPTPICNPGEKSLIAASQPATSNYYYYLWNKEANGNHVFAETYKEHLQNRKTYGYL